MSHPNPLHDQNNQYPADDISHYPQKKKRGRAKRGGPLHNVADRLSAKAQALRKMIEGK